MKEIRYCEYSTAAIEALYLISTQFITEPGNTKKSGKAQYN
jgi:hypothetical protein